MKYKHIFFDLDHTLWDFDANSRDTLAHLHQELNLGERGIHDFDLFHKTYLAHNLVLWDRYRKGQIKQADLRLKRMWLTLVDFKIADEELAKEMGDIFLQLLPTRTLLFPDTKEVLQYLRDKGYELHLITNGFEHTQHCKLANSGIDHFFTHVITSEGSNSLKPEKEIFDYALRLTGATPGESLMIGDALDIDIAGAMNAGIDQVHTNFGGEAQHLTPTYTVRELKELKTFL